MLELLESRTGLRIAFEVLEACLAYRAPHECGMAKTAELKGVSRVFVDTTGSREGVEGESYDRTPEIRARWLEWLRGVSLSR
jgi:hypothetical protein